MFRVLGTPNEAVWPGILELEDFKVEFPQWAPKDFSMVRALLVVAWLQRCSLAVHREQQRTHCCAAAPAAHSQQPGCARLRFCGCRHACSLACCSRPQRCRAAPCACLR